MFFRRLFPIVTFILITVNVVAQEYVTEFLIGYWSMDRETIEGNIVKDLSGKNNHGTIMGDPRIVKGKINEGLYFDGIDDYIALPDLGNRLEATIEVWAKDDIMVGVGSLVSSVFMEEMENTILSFSGGNGCVDVFLEFPNGFSNSPGCDNTPPNTWRHFVLTSNMRKHGEDIFIYKDGCCDFGIEDRGIDFDPSPLNFTKLRIGSGGKGKQFSGVIDEVRIYRRALAYEQIRQNYEYKLPVDKRGKLTTIWGALKK